MPRRKARQRAARSRKGREFGARCRAAGNVGGDSRSVWGLSGWPADSDVELTSNVNGTALIALRTSPHSSPTPRASLVPWNDKALRGRREYCGVFARARKALSFQGTSEAREMLVKYAG